MYEDGNASRRNHEDYCVSGAAARARAWVATWSARDARHRGLFVNTLARSSSGASAVVTGAVTLSITAAYHASASALARRLFAFDGLQFVISPSSDGDVASFVNANGRSRGCAWHMYLKSDDVQHASWPPGRQATLRFHVTAAGFVCMPTIDGRPFKLRDSGGAAASQQSGCAPVALAIDARARALAVGYDPDAPLAQRFVGAIKHVAVAHDG
jgi:hypothetical protein